MLQKCTEPLVKLLAYKCQENNLDNAYYMLHAAYYVIYAAYIYFLYPEKRNKNKQPKKKTKKAKQNSTPTINVPLFAFVVTLMQITLSKLN